MSGDGISDKMLKSLMGVRENVPLFASGAPPSPTKSTT